MGGVSCDIVVESIVVGGRCQKRDGESSKWAIRRVVQTSGDTGGGSRMLRNMRFLLIE